MYKLTPTKSLWIGSTLCWVLVLGSLCIPSLFHYFQPANTSSVPLFVSLGTAIAFSFLAAHLDALGNRHRLQTFDNLQEENVRPHAPLATWCWGLAIVFSFIAPPSLYMFNPNIDAITPFIKASLTIALFFVLIAFIVDDQHLKTQAKNEKIRKDHIEDELQLLDDPIPVQSPHLGRNSPAFQRFMAVLLANVPQDSRPSV